MYMNGLSADPCGLGWRVNETGLCVPVTDLPYTPTLAEPNVFDKYGVTQPMQYAILAGAVVLALMLLRR